MIVREPSAHGYWQLELPGGRHWQSAGCILSCSVPNGCTIQGPFRPMDLGISNMLNFGVARFACIPLQP